MKTILVTLTVLFLLTISVTAQVAPTPKPTDAPKAAQPPSENADQPPQPPRYKLLRSEEDWSFLADKSKRSDYLDPIKYIRLRDDRDDWFLTLGGEIRPFYENIRHENFGASVPDNNGYLLQRYMFHANLRLSRNFRAFAEIKSGLIAGRRGGARPPDKDKLDFNQAFAEFDFGFDKKSGDKDKPPPPPKFALRVGRQELDYGSGRLISVREGPNVRQSFDGARIILNLEKFNVETFFVKPVDTPFGVFDDAAISSSSFWGVYATRPLTIFHRLLPKSNLDVYYFGIDRKLARFD